MSRTKRSRARSVSRRRRRAVVSLRALLRELAGDALGVGAGGVALLREGGDAGLGVGERGLLGLELGDAPLERLALLGGVGQAHAGVPRPRALGVELLAGGGELGLGGRAGRAGDLQVALERLEPGDGGRLGL